MNQTGTALVTIGDTVKLKGHDLIGVVRFIGEIEHKSSIYYGIELLITKQSYYTLNDGSINNRYYFKTNNDRKGTFVKGASIKQIVNKNNDVLRITIGDTVRVTKCDCFGVIKYIGKPTNNYISYGIELKEPKGTYASNGSLNNVSHFKCKGKYGIFVEAKDLMTVKHFNLTLKLDKYGLYHPSKLYHHDDDCRCGGFGRSKGRCRDGDIWNCCGSFSEQKGCTMNRDKIIKQLHEYFVENGLIVIKTYIKHRILNDGGYNNKYVMMTGIDENIYKICYSFIVDKMGEYKGSYPINTGFS